MIGLARLATLTERVTVGTSILLLPLYPPALVAKQIADLDRATDGRVILGVGVGGEYPQEFRAVQVPIEERGRRTERDDPADPATVDRRGDHPRGPLLPDAGREDPPSPGAAGRSADHRRRPEGAGDATGGDAGRRVVPLPVLAPSLRRLGRRPSAGPRRTPGRDLSGVRLVRVGVRQRQRRRRHRARGSRPHDGRHLQPGLPRHDRQRRRRGNRGRGRRRSYWQFYDAGARHFVFIPATAGADPRPVLDRLFTEVAPALHEHAMRAAR